MAFTDYLQELLNPALPLSTSKLVNLSRMDAAESAAFREVWQELSVERRRQVIIRLNELAEDNVELNFDTVFLAALNDADPEIRVRAIRGLWEYEGSDFIARLVSLLQTDADPSVRAEAALALGRFAVQAEFDAVRERDMVLMDTALQRVITDPSEALEVRARAVEAVGARSAPWAQALVREAYHSGNQRLRVSALHAMGRSCDAQWLSILIAELRNEDPEIRYEAAGALGAIGDEAAVSPLLELLHDEDAEVQVAAISALGEISSTRARRALQRLATHPSPHVRDAVQAALREIDFADDPLSFTFLP